ncbi:MAG TPA: L-iditol 2-dehydrogenase [Acidiphilium sp.]|jgi:D-sorbitol dehydrogenase (acceptor)|uniref:L-iditol 2-dehydrogenase n=1 Tax=unclassified Acidiphilium TaxID=2617493 RepID=UPI000BCE0E5C|nr:MULTISPECIES: L-iditol 2-dehydrogenase [unclassified Acidiphilium]OYV56829.1 MAG: sorbitol dehydrogenase [Acidiphilium sp. 20-67-58]HQT60432.1 L-iditol 2-dehydrogenase [Acidiphilium sp.]HQU10080.1 L-iditol 2-dehydrogenase [Acidiphilium sp.]
MSGRLQGKYAAITGGAGGIGRAMAAGYIAEGARVCIADRSREAAEAIARELGPQAHACALDVAEMDSIAAFADFTAARGGLDILVNNAAVFDLAPIADITEASYDLLFAVNVKGLLFTLQAVARQMIANGRRGRIINMASQAGRRGEALVGVYCATKASVISLTQSAGLDLIRHGIRVNAISPGVVDTPMWQQVDALFAHYENLSIGEKKRQVGLAVPYGRMGRPDDLVGAAIFLASDEAEYIIAQTLNVDGGNCMN